MKVLIFLLVFFGFGERSFAKSSLSINIATDDECLEMKGLCALERTIAQKVCDDHQLICHWKVFPWEQLAADMEKTENDGLYDIIMAGVEAKESRRKHKLFGHRYFTGKHLFIGKKNLSQLSVNRNGFPRLRIGTWKGFLFEELELAYGKNNPGISLVETSDHVDALINNKVDLIFTFTGAENQLLNQLNILNPYTYTIKGDFVDHLRPKGKESGVGVVFHKNSRGCELERYFSKAIRDLKKSGEYMALTQRYLGFDSWPYEQDPKLDEFCQ